MAKNTHRNSRLGAVKSRSQFVNPLTGRATKRDTRTGQFVAVKTSGGLFKGVRREK
jgi:hypothetical protein